ncbi:putative adenylate kinase (plasmid) [Arthrobacter sp. Rue61a]|nr:putative adenylate kinase [Arthrobacter sp. Rue61a]
MVRLLIIGPPGSGKGTQAEFIADHFGIVPISTGDLFRAHVKNQSLLGVEAKKYIDAGDFVPDNVTNRMVRGRLGEEDIRGGFLLDGYPRTIDQVAYLDEILAENNQRIDAVLQVSAPDEELVRRLRRRAEEIGRSDDTEPVIHHRLDLYHEQTEAMVSAYADRGVLARIDGRGTVTQVRDSALQALNAIESATPARNLHPTNAYQEKKRYVWPDLTHFG